MTNLDRSAGILLHPTSLPSGRLDTAAYRFVDWLASAGLSWWQMLPIGQPDSVGSPYFSPSAFAGWKGLLARPDAPVAKAELDAFRERNAYWVDGYLAYSGADALADQVRFEREWRTLRAYARARGVRLIGDVPIYVAPDGADQREHPHLFLEGVVAGAAPDLRHPAGQLWGNPLYDWHAIAAEGYRWWIERLRRTLDLFDVARVDHFRGFAAAWAIPAGSRDPAVGTFLPGPYDAVFEAARAELGDLPLIVEDLGLITPDVTELRERLGVPGMGVLVRGFDGPPENPSRPRNHRQLQAVYTSTHDTDTARGWYESLDADLRATVPVSPEEPHWGLIEIAAASPARLAMIQLQDVLGLGSEGRMNTPGTVGPQNWSWRFRPGDLTSEQALRVRTLLERHGRENAAATAAA
jgi:4-alpha-glucanotransferase